MRNSDWAWLAGGIAAGAAAGMLLSSGHTRRNPYKRKTKKRKAHRANPWTPWKQTSANGSAYISSAHVSKMFKLVDELTKMLDPTQSKDQSYDRFEPWGNDVHVDSRYNEMLGHISFTYSNGDKFPHAFLIEISERAGSFYWHLSELIYSDKMQWPDWVQIDDCSGELTSTAELITAVKTYVQNKYPKK